MAETMAPGFVTPPRGVQVPPVVSIVGTGRPLSEGIQLHHNRDKYGFFLNKEIEGFGLAPFENTTQPRASGGATLRHRRTAEGTMFLPLTLVSPNPASMYDMMAWLVDTVTGQGGFFDVVFFDPYSQEARRRTVLYDSGLETVNEQIPDFKHIVGLTGTFLSPFWRGPERVVVERIAPPVKPLITADPGSPVNRWDDPGFGDSTAYEPWFVVDAGLEKNGTGAEHGVFVSGHRVAVNPGETVSVSAGLSYADGPNVGAIEVRVRSYDADSILVAGSTQTVISESYGGTYTGTYVVPATGAEIELGFYTASDVHANTRARIDNLNVQRGIQYVARYEWEGEPHNSPSIKRDHTGNIVARNLFIDPRFTDEANFTLHNQSLTTHVFGAMDGYGLELRANSGTANSRPRALLKLDIQPPGEWALSIAAQRVADGGDMRFIFFGDGGASATVYAPSSTVWERHTVAASVPHEWDRLYLEFSDFGPEDPGTVYGRFDEAVLALGATEQSALDQVSTYFDGDFPDVVDEGSREGAFSFPFFPVFLADSTVQGEHELRVEGDAPVWPVWEIQGPGRDVEIIGPDGSRLFVEGEVSSPITIVTEPGKRSIRDASGLIWDRMKPGDDQFFALQPGEQTVRMTMVGGNPESTIKAVYSENWKTPRGTAQAMIGGVDTE